MENHHDANLRDMSEMPESIIISELVVNTEVRGWLLAEAVQNRTTKNGKQYRELKLRDQRGNVITARQFDLPHREIYVPQTGMVALIEGLIEKYQNTLQIKLTRAELEEQPGRGFTVDGTLFGHIFLGAQYGEQHAKQVTEMEEATRLYLLHIILAHHGTKEFGSPVHPATIEAFIVHLADMTEAKLTGFLDHCDRTSTADGWSSHHKDFGGPLRAP